MVEKFLQACCTLLSALMGLALAAMVVLVFGNVFLRYGFNSGITLSEELSRWLFVWMTFMGAVVALKNHGHLGTDMLVGKLGPLGRKLCFGLSHLVMLWMCYLLGDGAWTQAMLNLESTSAVMEVSLSWLYAPAVLTAVLGAVIILHELLRLLSGNLGEGEMVTIQESEESCAEPRPGERP